MITPHFIITPAGRVALGTTGILRWDKRWVLESVEENPCISLHALRRQPGVFFCEIVDATNSGLIRIATREEILVHTLRSDQL